jgi:cell division protein FtsB
MKYDKSKLNAAITAVYTETQNQGMTQIQVIEAMFLAGYEYMKAENEALEAENKLLKDKIVKLTDQT